VRVPNETENETGNAFAELLRLQTEFQTKLVEDTLTHLRRLQGAAMPVAPTTVLKPGGVSELWASGTSGATVILNLELENRQRVHCVVSPVLSPLVETSGVTWFPAIEPMTLLLAPEEIAPLSISMAVPGEIPVGVYRGALLLQGFRTAAIAVAIDVTNSTNKTKNSQTAAAGAKASRRSTSRKKGAPKAKETRRGSRKSS